MDRRLTALERAMAGDDPADVDSELTAGGSAADRQAGDDRLDELAERVAELEAATQAVRGYVGGVRAVNRTVERRADAALAAVARLDSTADVASETGTTDAASETDRTAWWLDADGEPVAWVGEVAPRE